MSADWTVSNDWRADAFKQGDRVRFTSGDDEPRVVIVDKIVPGDDGISFALYVHPERPDDSELFYAPDA